MSLEMFVTKSNWLWYGSGFSFSKY